MTSVDGLTWSRVPHDPAVFGASGLEPHKLPPFNHGSNAKTHTQHEFFADYILAWMMQI